MRSERASWRLPRKTAGLLLLVIGLLTGAGGAIAFAGVTFGDRSIGFPVAFLWNAPERDYATVLGTTLEDELEKSRRDTGEVAYTRNSLPASMLLPPPSSTDPKPESTSGVGEAEADVFSSFALIGNQAKKLQNALQALKAKPAEGVSAQVSGAKPGETCNPRDAACIRRLACKGVITPLFSSQQCAPGDLICRARMSCS